MFPLFAIVADPVSLGIGAAVLAVGGFLVYANRQKLGITSADPAAAIDPVATKVFAALKDLEGKVTLSPPGRSVLSDVTIFLETPIMAFPDSPQRQAAITGRLAIYELFGSAPPTPPVVATPPSSVS